MTDFQRALLTLLEGGQGITLNVITTPAPLVTELQQKVDRLSKDMQTMERDLSATHRRYRESVLLNERLFLWMREQNITPPEEETHRSLKYFRMTDPNEWK